MPEPDRMEQVRALYEAAMFGGDAAAADKAEQELDAIEAPLALERGKLLHVRFLNSRVEDPQELVLFERAAELYRRLGDAAGEAESLFWIGCWHQVAHDDDATAGPYFERAYTLASSVGERTTMSYAARHIGFIEQLAGRLDQARARFTESVDLRREVGFTAGVAAGLLTLAQLAATQGDRAAAVAQLDEAQALAEEIGAKNVLTWIERARGEL